MYNVVLDTNILHQEGLSSNDMSILKNLVDAGLVCIHIPSLVAQEFITKRIGCIKEESGKIIKALDVIEKEARRINSIAFENKKDILQELKFVDETIEEKAKASFDAWVKKLRVNILHPEQVYFSQVFNDYFSGEGVFRQVKARDDIPDAFINICIESLIESVGNLIVIIKDERLKRHFEKNEKIKTLSGLRELFNENGLEKTLANDRITKFIISEGLRKGLLAFLEISPYYFEYFNEVSDSVTGDILIGVRVYGVNIEIEAYNTINNLFITDVREISKNKFSATCVFTIDTSIGYITDYASYLEITRMQGRKPDCWSMNGDGWCDIIEEAKIRLFADLTVKLTKEYGQIDKVDVFNELRNNHIIMSMNVTDVHIEEMI